jgi:hypothetical protein
MSTISDTQRRFIHEYLADPNRNGAAAAARAGYGQSSAKQTAYKLLHNAEILREMDRQMKMHLAKLEVDAEMVISGIVDTINEAKASGSGAWQMQAQQRGYELLGKYLGLFSERVESAADEKVIERLMRGRKRAAGLLRGSKFDISDASDDGNENQAADAEDSPSGDGKGEEPVN